jgi:hypothetical protein
VPVAETEKQHGESTTLREMDHARVTDVLQPSALEADVLRVLVMRHLLD